MHATEIRQQLERHHEEAFGWARLCCGQDAVEAEEVLQTVYLKVLEERARFAGKSSFKTWLFAVVRQTAAESRRRRILQRFRRQRLAERMQQNSPAPYASDRTEEAEAQAAIGHMLQQLPRRQREVLQLMFYHEMTLERAAEVMGISPGAARKHYDRAKRKARALLRKSEAFDAKK